MQKLLKRQQGFTLVELLVVIAIIAILAVIGLTVFTGLQRGARDAQRRADIEAITRGLEAGYSTVTAQYPTLETSNFAGGRIPQDPLQGQAQACAGIQCGYCINTVSNGGQNPIGAVVTVAGGNFVCSASAGVVPHPEILKATFPDISGATGFIVCANLETGGGNVGGTTYCQGNQR